MSSWMKYSMILGLLNEILYDIHGEILDEVPGFLYDLLYELVDEIFGALG